MRESVVEAYLVARVKELGGECRKVNWVGRRGAPDRLVMLPHRTTLWIEVKAPGEKAKPHQLREHARMRSMGQWVEVVDSIEGIEELIK